MFRGRETKVHVCLETGSSWPALEHRVWGGSELEAEVVKSRGERGHSCFGAKDAVKGQDEPGPGSSGVLGRGQPYGPYTGHQVFGQASIPDPPRSCGGRRGGLPGTGTSQEVETQKGV